MIKYEYKTESAEVGTIDGREGLENQLNGLAHQRWRLIAIMPITNHRPICIFERIVYKEK